MSRCWMTIFLSSSLKIISERAKCPFYCGLSIRKIVNGTISGNCHDFRMENCTFLRRKIISSFCDNVFGFRTFFLFIPLGFPPRSIHIPFDSNNSLFFIHTCTEHDASKPETSIGRCPVGLLFDIMLQDVWKIYSTQAANKNAVYK